MSPPGEDEEVRRREEEEKETLRESGMKNARKVEKMEKMEKQDDDEDDGMGSEEGGSGTLRSRCRGKRALEVS